MTFEKLYDEAIHKLHVIRYYDENCSLIVEEKIEELIDLINKYKEEISNEFNKR